MNMNGFYKEEIELGTGYLVLSIGTVLPIIIDLVLPIGTDLVLSIYWYNRFSV